MQVFSRPPTGIARDSLKQALKTYAVERGMTETGAAVTLLERALEAIEDEASVAQLKRKLEAATRELETTRAALHEAELQQRAAAHVYKAVLTLSTDGKTLTLTGPHLGSPITLDTRTFKITRHSA